jgi:hypothetical protein
MDYVKMAEQALTQPEETWFSNENLWHSHGMSGFSVHRDSDILDSANFLAVTNLLNEKYGEEDSDGNWFIVHSTHWAVGWVDQIMVRILVDPEIGVQENNLTPIFMECMDLFTEIREINPILDESLYDQLVTDEQIREINSWHPRWVDGLKFDAEKIYEFFMDNDIYPYGDGADSWFWGPEFIASACFMLGMYDDADTAEVVNEIESFLDMNSNSYETKAMQEVVIEFINYAKEIANAQPHLF